MGLALRTIPELKRDLVRFREQQRAVPMHSEDWHRLDLAINRALDELAAAHRP